MRKYTALATVVAVSFLLAGCASTNEFDRISAGTVQTCADFVGGDEVNQISVSSDLTKAPKVDFPTPITSAKIQSHVIVEGSGMKFTGNQLVSLEYVGYNGKTGAVFQTSKFDGSDSASEYLKPGGTPDFCKALGGVRAGSRVAVLYPPKDAHDNQGVAQLGIDKDASVIFVFDVKSVSLSRAVGDVQPAQAGFPSVSLTPAGAPGVTFNGDAAPTNFKVATLIKGRGATVKKGQTVIVNYTGVIWGTGVKFDSSWDADKKPVPFPLTDGQLIPGFIKALVGQSVGSQVIAIVPPADGYGSSENGTIPANSTLVFVVDILAIK